MKKLMFAFCLMLGGAVAVNAQDTTSTSTQGTESQSQYQDTDKYDQKDVVPTSELPQKVQEQLQSQDYTGWTVSNAYRKEKEGKTMYAVEMRNGSEKKMVKFDADGNKLKEKSKDDQ